MNQTKKELQKLKNESEKLSNKKLEIEAKLNLDDADYQRKIKQINKKRQKELNLNTNAFGQIDSGKELKINTKYDSQIANLGLQMEKSVDKADYQLNQIETQLEQNVQKQKQLNQAIDEMGRKLGSVDDGKISKSIDDSNKKIGNTIKKVAKWALAVFAVESAYGFIRNSISILSGYNDQLAADVEYIQFAIASTLEPVIERIVGWVYKLLQYVNYLAQAWFNVNLFANASEKNFKKANQSAKQLNKSLSGFDEINQLSDNSNGNGSDVSPSVDLSSMENIEIPTWLEKFAEFGKPIIDFFQNIIDKYGLVAGGIMIVVGALAGFRIIKSIIKLFTGMGDAIKKGKTDFTDFFKSLGKAVESIALLGGLSLVIESITDLIDTFSKSGMTLGEVAGLLGIVLGEVAAAFIVLLGAMTLLQPSWQSIAGAAIIFAGLALVLQSVCDLMDTFSESGLSLTDVIGLMTTVLVTIVGLMGSIVLLGPSMTAGLMPFSILIAEISAVLLVMAATLPIILNAVGDFIEQTAPSLCDILETIGTLIENLIYALGTILPPVIESVGSLFATIFNGISSVVNSVGNGLVSILNAIGNLVNSVLSSLLGFIINLGPAINTFVDSAISAVTKLINFMISGIEYLVNTLVIDGVNAIIKGINSIGKYVGFTIPTLARFKIARFKPTYMATGGIIDVPKRGVPLATNVIGGEAGAEGVLPLTDENTMRRLGQEIARWIVLNIQLNNYIDGRLLAKYIKQIMNGQEFSRNGGIS